MIRRSLTKIIAALVVTAGFASPSAHAAVVYVPSSCLTASGTPCQYIASTTGSIFVIAASVNWSITVSGGSTCISSTYTSIYVGYSCTVQAGQTVTNNPGSGVLYSGSYVPVPNAPTH